MLMLANMLKHLIMDALFYYLYLLQPSTDSKEKFTKYSTF